jgi:hypothetical protein
LSSEGHHRQLIPYTDRFLQGRQLRLSPFFFACLSLPSGTPAHRVEEWLDRVAETYPA